MDIKKEYAHGRRNFSDADLSGAALSGADLSGANLSSADLSNISMCRCVIDGATLSENDIGGPGHILYALTEQEAALIQNARNPTNQ